jgi:hypothetical protein
VEWVAMHLQNCLNFGTCAAKGVHLIHQYAQEFKLLP